MLVSGVKRLGVLRTSRLGLRRSSSRSLSSDALPPLLKKTTTGNNGLCGLGVQHSSDIRRMVDEVLEDCDRKVALLERYEQSTPSEVRSELFKKSNSQASKAVMRLVMGDQMGC